jgi:hypothetical protein
LARGAGAEPCALPGRAPARLPSVLPEMTTRRSRSRKAALPRPA